MTRGVTILAIAPLCFTVVSTVITNFMNPQELA